MLQTCSQLSQQTHKSKTLQKPPFAVTTLDWLILFSPFVALEYNISFFLFSTPSGYELHTITAAVTPALRELQDAVAQVITQVWVRRRVRKHSAKDVFTCTLVVASSSSSS